MPVPTRHLRWPPCHVRNLRSAKSTFGYVGCAWPRHRRHRAKKWDDYAVEWIDQNFAGALRVLSPPQTDHFNCTRAKAHACAMLHPFDLICLLGAGRKLLPAACAHGCISCTESVPQISIGLLRFQRRVASIMTCMVQMTFLCRQAQSTQCASKSGSSARAGPAWQWAAAALAAQLYNFCSRQGDACEAGTLLAAVREPGVPPRHTLHLRSCGNNLCTSFARRPKRTRL